MEEEFGQTNYISEKDWKEVFPNISYPESVFNGIKLPEEQYEKWVTLWKKSQKEYQKECKEKIDKSGKKEEEIAIETMLYMMNRSFEELKDKKRVNDLYLSVYDDSKDEKKHKILEIALKEFNKEKIEE